MRYYAGFESFEIWFWRRVEKIIWTNSVKKKK